MAKNKSSHGPMANSIERILKPGVGQGREKRGENRTKVCKAI